MKPHVEQTINDIQAQIRTLTSLCEALASLDCPVPLATIEHGNAELNPASLPKITVRVTKSPATPGRKPKVASGINEKLLEILPGLSSPFDQGSVMSAMKKTGFDLTQVRGALSYMAKTGRLVTVQKGKPGSPSKYALPGKAAASKPSVVSVPGLDAPQLSIDEQLEKALRDRDAARARGNETLEKIYQDKISKLEAQLEQ